MGFFSIFGNKPDKNQDLPWNNRVAILSHIQSSLDKNGKLNTEGLVLPDDKNRFSDGEVRWVAGGMDGAFSHHGSTGNAELTAEKVAALVNEIALRNALPKKIELYNLLLEDSLMDYIDPTLERLNELQTPIEPYLHNYARWLAFESPDRGSVKFGIALLGIIGEEDDSKAIQMLGKHEEFTLYSAVAISNIFEDPELILWEMAKAVDGWGKIHLVEMLAETSNPLIKSWLVREGYKNSIMYEYLAYTCAVAGGLKQELSNTRVDEALLDGAGNIIQALISGGPAEDISDYTDGVDVVHLYLNNMQAKADFSFNDYLVFKSIRDFLSSEYILGEAYTQQGWNKEATQMQLALVKKFMSSTNWAAMVEFSKDTDDDVLFWQTDQVATDIGVDLWGTHWARLQSKPHDAGRWYSVLRNANDERIDGILTFANEALPLSTMGRGPEDNMGIGPGYEIYSCLDFILQDLEKYPHKGLELIKVGLRSPVTRNRNMAINALSAWQKEQIPDELYSIVREAIPVEPNNDTKSDLEGLLDKLAN